MPKTSFCVMNDSGTGYGVDSLGVRSKIASFEAFNETVRSGDSFDRRSDSGISPNSTSSGNAFPSKIGEPEAETCTSLEQSTTALASHNRKSRLQRSMNETRQNQAQPGSLMQRRISAKERRRAALGQQVKLSRNQQPKGQPGEQAIQHQKGKRQSSFVQTSNHSQPVSPKKALVSPSSVSSTRSPARLRSKQSRSPASSNGASGSLSHSPNMRAATAAAQQHRASLYANTYNSDSFSQQQPQQQHTQQQHTQQQHTQQQHTQQQQQHRKDVVTTNGSSGSSIDQENSRSKGPLSRFHKLKMKGMDHARLAQKRKQANQRTENREDPRASQHSAQRQSSTPEGVQQHEITHHHRPFESSPPESHEQPQPQPLKSQDSPDHQTTDDEATLTSVARILDQEHIFAAQNRSFMNENDPSNRNSHHMTSFNSTMANMDTKSPHHVWAGGEEKSDKINNGLYPRPSSSSEFEPEAQHNYNRMENPYSMPGMLNEAATPSPQHQSQNYLLQQQRRQQQTYYNQQNQHYDMYHHQQQHSHYSPQHSAAGMSPQERVGLRRTQGSFSQHQFNQSSSARMDDDDRTFDYGVKDDESQGSTTFQQQLREAERKAREHSQLSEGNVSQSDSVSRKQTDSVSRKGNRRSKRDVSSPALKSDDGWEDYRQSMENSKAKTAAGLCGAAALGCFVVGPVGFLLGAAAVGIGVGVMQIPEEQRNNMAEKATKAFSHAQDQALSASEMLSTSCAATYKDSGIAEHIPDEITDKFCAPSQEDVDGAHIIAPDIKSEESEALRHDQLAGSGTAGRSESLPPKNQDPRKPISPNQPRSMRNKKVACLRHVRIVPVNQIHSLDPAAQPRAWLDVIASADTSSDEKTEAMEEILILAKDKQYARIFLEEGILDSIMWTLGRYFEKENCKSTDQWANPEISPEERKSAKLAATCCVTLGKAHCAAIHTEGDLLLMSLYERGTVPEERQLAQMLYEVPHHARVTKTDDPTVVDPSVEVFALKQLTLPQAEEMASSIKSLADGR